jgi:hypothetical protein
MDGGERTPQLGGDEREEIDDLSRSAFVVPGVAYLDEQRDSVEGAEKVVDAPSHGSGYRAKERLKSFWRDSDRVRYAHVVQFAALAEAVHRGRGHAEPCSHLFESRMLGMTLRATSAR